MTDTVSDLPEVLEVEPKESRQQPKLEKRFYETELRRLQEEMVKLQEAGFEIGCHSSTHPNLLNLTAEAIRRQHEEQRPDPKSNHCLMSHVASLPIQAGRRNQPRGSGSRAGNLTL